MHKMLLVIVLFVVVSPYAYPQTRNGSDRPKITQSKPSLGIGNGFRQPPSDAIKLSIRADLHRSSAVVKNAQRLLREGELTTAEAECRRALNLSPLVNGKRWNTRALQVLGEVHLAQGRNQEALQCFLESSQSTRGTVLNLNTALCYVRLGNYTQARKFYSDQMILRYAHSLTARDLPGTGTLRTFEASILSAKATDLQMSVQKEEALETWLAAGRLAPTNAFIARSTAYSLERLDREWEAEPFYEKVAKYGRGEQVKDAKLLLENYASIKSRRVSSGLPATPLTPAQQAEMRKRM